MEKVEFQINGRTVGIETGRYAKQSNGSVLVTCGDTAVLVTANRSKPREGIDFFPLTVDYFEKTYAAGKIPGGFFKREGRQTEKEILTSRFIDRALRPLIPEIAKADLSIIVAGSRDVLVMVEGGAAMLPESDIVAALRFGHEVLQPVIAAQEDLARRAGKTKRALTPSQRDPELVRQIEALAMPRIREASKIAEKHARYAAFDAIDKDVSEALLEEFRRAPRSFTNLAEFEEVQGAARKQASEIRKILHDLRGSEMRRRILDGEPRLDGRSAADIRRIQCEITPFSRIHGSAVFTRGETQALAAVTLGGARDEQMVEGLQDTQYRNFYLHYNFPPFSVGETKPLRGPNRREQGHGALAQRAIAAVLPDMEELPYTLRVVSEVLESNGSSSMATVCASALALMDAGIQIKAPVAGIAMGLIQEGKRYAVLSDILGDEDHLGDMDFKVAGTREGIAAIQMDIKIDGLDWEVMEKALEQARVGRLHILDRMEEQTADVLPGFAARSELSQHAPRVEVLWIKPDRIRDLIGPGGKVIRAIQESSSAKIDVEDSGRVVIFAPNGAALDRCRAMVEETTQEAEVGRHYVGKVKRVTDFGAFVEIFPGTDGLLHISELCDRRVDKVEDICVEGDEVMVKCIDVDPSGKIRLSRRAALADGVEAAAAR